MSIKSRTRGPWQIIDLAPPITIWKDDGQGDGPVICLVGDNFTDYSDGENCNELEANARLISAAPELLEALDALNHGFIDGSIKFANKRVSDSDSDHPAKTLMDAALAKAKGY